jgi:hypothetical protein
VSELPVGALLNHTEGKYMVILLENGQGTPHIAIT